MKKIAKKTKRSLSVTTSRGKAKIKKVMKEFKEGEMHSGKKTGPVVTNRKQAIAIALSKARKTEKKKSKN